MRNFVIMKYLIRALKQFVYLTVFLCLILFILVKAGLAQADISEMFVNGYDSIWQIALIIAAFAAVYPRLGYSSREVHAYGSDEELRPGLREVMEDRGYRLEKEDGETVCFVKRAPLTRLIKMWEDRITVTRTATGFSVEGLTKDVVRIVSALEYRFSLPKEDE